MLVGHSHNTSHAPLSMTVPGACAGNPAMSLGEVGVMLDPKKPFAWLEGGWGADLKVHGCGFLRVSTATRSLIFN